MENEFLGIWQRADLRKHIVRIRDLRYCLEATLGSGKNRPYLLPMADTTFPEWLERALAGRPNVFLVRNSGTKKNGRPVIDDSRVSKWRKGEQRPSPELAQLAAKVLGRPESEGLEAAGYSFTVTPSVDEQGVIQVSIGGEFREWVESTDVLTNYQREQVLHMMDETLPNGIPIALLPDLDVIPDGDLKEKYKRAIESDDPVLREFAEAQIAKARRADMSEAPDTTDVSVPLAADEDTTPIERGQGYDENA